MRTLRAHKKSGFTLLEGVFSLFITFLVLAALTYTLKQAGSVKSNTKNLNKMTETMHSLLLLKSDVRAALDITSPSGSGSSSVLEFTRIDPSLSFLSRVDETGGEDPFETDERITIEYRLVDGVLRRIFTPTGGSLLSQRLLRADSFQVSRTSSPEMLHVVLEVSNERTTKTHAMRVSLE